MNHNLSQINRRPLRAKLGSRVVRRFGTKSAGKTLPKVLVGEMVRAELAKRGL